MILSCIRCQDNSGCGAAFQNKVYGHGNRVHNELASKSGNREYRCTVCESTRSAGK